MTDNLIHATFTVATASVRFFVAGQIMRMNLHVTSWSPKSGIKKNTVMEHPVDLDKKSGTEDQHERRRAITHIIPSPRRPHIAYFVVDFICTFHIVYIGIRR